MTSTSNVAARLGGSSDTVATRDRTEKMAILTAALVAPHRETAGGLLTPARRNAEQLARRGAAWSGVERSGAAPLHLLSACVM